MTRISPFLEARTVELSGLLANRPLHRRPGVVGVARMTIVFPLPMPVMVARGTWKAWRTLARKLVVAALASSELRLGCVLVHFLYFGSGTTPGSHGWQGTASTTPVKGSTACSNLRMIGVGMADWSVAAMLRGQRL
jgi:hypothetical protein